jgi:site-specific recombinase XerD
MIDRYFTLTKIRTRLRSGPLGPFFPAFITSLEERGYASPSIRRMVRTADQLGRWIQKQGVTLQEANRDRIDQYVTSQGRRSDQRTNSSSLSR